MSRFANFEAVKSLTSGLELTAKMPKGEALDWQELSLRLALGPPLLATRGYASSDVERNYEAAHRLAESLGDREAAFTSARGLWNCFYDRGDQNRSLVLAERLLALASESDSAEKRALALRALGSSRMSRAEFAQSLEAFDGCVAVSTSLPLGSACIERHGEEPRIVATQYRGLVLCMLGFADQALEATRLAATLAKTINHPLSMALPPRYSASSRTTARFSSLRDPRQRTARLLQGTGFRVWSAAFRSTTGSLPPIFVAKAIQRSRPRRVSSTGSIPAPSIHVPTWSSFLADAALVSGDVPLAEKALTSGIEIARRNGEVFALAELQRLNGCLSLKRDRPSRGPGRFCRGCGDGRAPRRATVSAACRAPSRADTGRDADPYAARALLQPVVEDFPEHRNRQGLRGTSELLASLQ